MNARAKAFTPKPKTQPMQILPTCEAWVGYVWDDEMTRIATSYPFTPVAELPVRLAFYSEPNVMVPPQVRVISATELIHSVRSALTVLT